MLLVIPETPVSGSQSFTYTGKDLSKLTGVSGITSSILIGDKVYPNIIYNGISGANVEVFHTGADLLNFGIKISIGSTNILNFPGLPAIFPQSQIKIGVSNALKVYMSTESPSGLDQIFTHVSLQCNNLFKRDLV